MQQNQQKILAMILMVVPLGGIGIDLYAAALPQFADDLGLNAAAVKMTLSIFLLGLCVGMFIFGILSDHYGRKPFQILNAVLFTVSSLLVPVSHNFYWVLCLRFIQGMSAGGMQSVARSMISDVFAREQITKISLYVTSVWGLGPVVAPAIGGYLTYYFGWQSCFYFFVTYGLIVSVAHLLCLHETHHQRRALKVKSLAINGLGIIKSTDFTIPVLSMGVAYSTLVLYGLVGPYFLQKSLHLSVVTYGNIGFILGFAYLAGTMSCRFLCHKYCDEKLLKFAVFGMILISLILVGLEQLSHGCCYLWVINIFVSCYAMGFVYPVYMARSIKAFSRQAGLASALVVSGVLLSASLFSFVFGFIHINTSLGMMLSYFALSIFITLLYLTKLYLDQKNTNHHVIIGWDND
ncbi:MAG: multidrug effflux MFS transporter [Proteobacteria bacterium]|nr:multidrug effflux MFS transporter [Pseudomonadota bacterium]